LELEKIAFNHSLSKYSFRSGGSSGANATADWLIDELNSFGVETFAEPFQFANWDVLSEPTLLIDDDGSPATLGDQTVIRSFQTTHYSWPSPDGGDFADLVVLPLPPAANYDEIGMNPIDHTAWNAIDTSAKIVLIGREVRWDYSWEEAYKNKLTVQSPNAVIYTWWYEWMSFTPPLVYSAGGRPGRTFGPYYWDLEIPVGFVDYDDGLWIRNRENSLNVAAKAEIDAVLGTGPHYNIIGKLNGTTYPDKFVIVSAHRDTVMCSGFADNGAGTAGVLELARIFSEANRTGLFRPKYTILFILFDSEEMGLVGSINYVMQHKSEMSDIVAFINLDCIGSDYLHVSMTDPATEFDLDEVALTAALDLSISASSTGSYGVSDDMPFLDPAWSDGMYLYFWGLSANIADAVPVNSSIGLIAYPITFRDQWNMGAPGWIHTSYDNSTSTTTLNWIEADDLEDHTKVAALTITRITMPLSGDVNYDGKVDMKDIGMVARAFGMQSTDPEWNPDLDIVKDNLIDMRDIGHAARQFGQTYS